MYGVNEFGSRRLEKAIPIGNIQVDASGLRRHLEAMVKVFGQSMQKVIAEQARLLCIDMMDYTMPYSPDPPKSGSNAGRNMNAWKSGEKRLGSNIDKVFKPLTTANWYDVAFQDDFSVFVAWYYDKMQAGHELPQWLVERGTIGVGEWTEFQSRYGRSEFRGSGFYPAPKKKGRKKNRFALHWDLAHGGTSKMQKIHHDIRGGTGKEATRDYSSNMKAYNGIWLVGGGKKKIDAYKRQAARHIGRLKSGWYHAGMALGLRPLKASYWIKSQPGDTAILENNLIDDKEPSITVGNRIHYNMSKTPGVGMWKQGLNHRAYSMRVKIAQSINRRSRGTVQEYIDMFKINDLVRSDYEPF